MIIRLAEARECLSSEMASLGESMQSFRWQIESIAGFALVEHGLDSAAYKALNARIAGRSALLKAHYVAAETIWEGDLENNAALAGLEPTEHDGSIDTDACQQRVDEALLSASSHAQIRDDCYGKAARVARSFSPGRAAVAQVLAESYRLMAAAYDAMAVAEKELARTLQAKIEKAVAYSSASSAFYAGASEAMAMLSASSRAARAARSSCSMSMDWASGLNEAFSVSVMSHATLRDAELRKASSDGALLLSDDRQWLYYCGQRWEITLMDEIGISISDDGSFITGAGGIHFDPNEIASMWEVEGEKEVIHDDFDFAYTFANAGASKTDGCSTPEEHYDSRLASLSENAVSLGSSLLSVMGTAATKKDTKITATFVSNGGQRKVVIRKKQWVKTGVTCYTDLIPDRQGYANELARIFAGVDISKDSPLGKSATLKVDTARDADGAYTSQYYFDERDGSLKERLIVYPGDSFVIDSGSGTWDATDAMFAKTWDADEDALDGLFD